MLSPGRAAAASALVLATGVLAACSSTTMIDATKAEAEVGTVLAGAGVATSSIRCPTDVEAVEGESFDCEVITDDDVTFAMVVTMVDDDGRVDLASSPDVVLMTTQVMQLAADEVAAQLGEDAELACPSAARLTAGTGTVDCSAETSSGAAAASLGFEAGQLVSATVD